MQNVWSDSDYAGLNTKVPSVPTQNFIVFHASDKNMERAKSVVHVEFEVFRHILMTIDVADLRALMVPEGDTVAEKRFDKGVKSAAELIANLGMRRQHRLPEDHPAYIAKGE